MGDEVGTNVDRVWEDEAFRAVDTSLGALILQLARWLA